MLQALRQFSELSSMHVKWDLLLYHFCYHNLKVLILKTFLVFTILQLRYTLEANFDHKFSSTSILFFIVIGFFWAYLIYTTCSGVRDNAGFEHREARDHQHVNNDEVLQRVNQGRLSFTALYNCDVYNMLTSHIGTVKFATTEVSKEVNPSLCCREPTKYSATGGWWLGLVYSRTCWLVHSQCWNIRLHFFGEIPNHNFPDTTQNFR